MPARTDFDDHNSSEDLLPVYALIGAETLIVGEAVSALRAKALTHAADFNRDEFRAGDTAMERIIQSCATLPMMAKRRYVHVFDVQKISAKEQPLLIDYIEKPAATTVLVLSGEKVDQRTKLGQALMTAGAYFSFAPPKQHELAPWIMRRAKKLGISIDSEAAALIAELIGTELGTIDRALEKLALHADGKIKEEDVEALVAPTRVHSIFDLTDALGERNLGKATLLVRNAIEGGESALLLLTMIARQFRQILQVKVLSKEGVAGKEIAARLGIRPFLMDSLAAQAKRYKTQELYLGLAAALRADIRLKSTRLNPEVVLDRLLIEVMEARA